MGRPSPCACYRQQYHPGPKDGFRRGNMPCMGRCRPGNGSGRKINASNGLDRLRNRCTLSAVFHSNADSGPTRHSLSTPQASQEILNWIDSDESSASILWLYGSAASGKSTLARRLCEICGKNGTLAASFFFYKGEETHRNGDSLVPTLAYQLTQVFPLARSHIKATVEKDPSILDKSRNAQLQHLFIEALHAKTVWPLWFQSILRGLTRKSGEPRLIVIDALDESQSPEIQCDLLRMISSALPRLALPLRFLIISRPESHIKRVFDHDKTFKQTKIRRIDLDREPNSRDSIRGLLTGELERIHHNRPASRSPLWLSSDSITTIVEKSYPQFIYAETVVEYIESLDYPTDECLEVILKNGIKKGAKPHARLDDLYMDIFLTVSEEDRDTVCCLFGILYLSTQKGYRHPYPSPKELERIFEMRNGETVESLMDPLLSLVALPEDPNSKIRILHTTLFDYLLDSSRSGVFHVDLQRSHEVLLRHYFLKKYT